MQIIHQENKGFFALSETGEKIGELLYVTSGDAGTLNFEHTIVQPEAEGKGIGKALVAYGVAFARENGRKIIPSCPYVAALFRRKPDDYSDVVAA